MGALRMTFKKAFIIVFIIVAWVMWKIYFGQGPSTTIHSKIPNDRNCIGNLCEDNDKGTSKGLVAGYRSFYFNGKPFRILSGSFHYFRTHPQQWYDRLKRMKAAGLNTVTTYVAWNVHERIHGEYNFQGLFSLPDFIKLVKELELLLIIRPGPYICAEWEFGGLPSWLLHDPNMVVRTSAYKPYLDAVKLYFDQLLPLLAKYTYKNGGPIVAFQLENEFGSYGSDPEYLQFLKTMYEQHGLHELLFTSDGKGRLPKGSLPGVLATINFKNDPLAALAELEKFQPDKPLMVTEFWPGWFDHWGEEHHEMHVEEFTSKVDLILSKNASINFYMFVGGTNFAFWNGANVNSGRNQATITSYDYDALISESGDCHPKKYKAFRELLIKHRLVSTPLPSVPPNSPKIAFGDVSITESLQFDDFIKLVSIKPTSLAQPVFMEFLNIYKGGGQGYGWILYRSSFNSGKSLRLQIVLQDRAQVFVNGRLLKVIHSKEGVVLDEVIGLDELRSENNVLDILVENMGRVNFKSFDVSRCGFQGKVELDGKLLSLWQLISLDFNDDFVKEVRKSESWRPYAAGLAPTLYRGYLLATTTDDTFLDMHLWTKGIVLVNGFNIGRYWRVGPQQTLYIPKPLLIKGRNEIIVFELEKPDQKLTFVSQPVLNDVKGA